MTGFYLWIFADNQGVHVLDMGHLDSEVLKPECFPATKQIQNKFINPGAASLEGKTATMSQFVTAFLATLNPSPAVFEPGASSEEEAKASFVHLTNRVLCMYQRLIHFPPMYGKRFQLLGNELFAQFRAWVAEVGRVDEYLDLLDKFVRNASDKL